MCSRCARWCGQRFPLEDFENDSRDTSWPRSSNSKHRVSGGIRSKTHSSGRGEPPARWSALRCLVLRWFERCHFEDVGRVRPRRFRARPPVRSVRCPTLTTGNAESATLSRRNRSRCVPQRGKPAGSVAMISRGSRIHTPTAASSTRNRGWSCTRRFRRNHRSVRMYLFRLHARASHRPPSWKSLSRPPSFRGCDGSCRVGDRIG